jgi:hypothetical protein
MLCPLLDPPVLAIGALSVPLTRVTSCQDDALDVENDSLESALPESDRTRICCSSVRGHHHGLRTYRQRRRLGNDFFGLGNQLAPMSALSGAAKERAVAVCH